MVIQGFGNVGSFLAKFLHEEGAKVIALSDSSGGVHNPAGIDVPAALVHKEDTGSLAGLRNTEPISNEDLVLLECDVLAPCALEQVITGENADRVRTKIICEGANGPVTPTADEILDERGILDPAGHPRQRGRRRRLVLRVGAGPPGVLLEGARGQREAQRHRDPRVQGNLAGVAGALDLDAHGLVRPGRAARRRGDHDARALPVTEVVLYHAQGCHLCEQARAVVDSVRAEHPFDLRAVDIGGDPELEARYREWLPVVEIDGERAFVYHVFADALIRKLARPRPPDA